MVSREEKSERLPPYASYSTWQKLMEALKTFLPDEVDRSYYGGLKLSGTSMKALRTSLRYLGLVDEKNRTTKKLRHLIRAIRGEGDEEKGSVLAEVLKDAYPPLFSEDFNLRSATLGKLSKYFEDLGARGQMQEKCISFFLSLASEAQIDLSPHLSGRSRLGIGRKSAVLKARQRRREARAKTTQAGAKLGEPSSAAGISLPELHPAIVGLLKELPAVDARWAKEQKDKWIRAFEATIEVIYPENQN